MDSWTWGWQGHRISEVKKLLFFPDLGVRVNKGPSIYWSPEKPRNLWKSHSVGVFLKDISNQVECTPNKDSLYINPEYYPWPLLITMAKCRAENISINRHGEGSANSFKLFWLHSTHSQSSPHLLSFGVSVLPALAPESSGFCILPFIWHLADFSSNSHN